MKIINLLSIALLPFLASGQGSLTTITSGRASTNNIVTIYETSYSIPPASPKPTPNQCSSDSGCPKGQICYSPSKEDPIPANSSSVCLGKECKREQVMQSDPCPIGQTCVMKIMGTGGMYNESPLSSKNTFCLSDRQCQFDDKQCAKGWSCVRNIWGGSYCAHSSFDWGGRRLTECDKRDAKPPPVGC